MDLGSGPEVLYLSSSCPNIMTCMANEVIDLGNYRCCHVEWWLDLDGPSKMVGAIENLAAKIFFTSDR